MKNLYCELSSFKLNSQSVLSHILRAPVFLRPSTPMNKSRRTTTAIYFFIKNIDNYHIAFGHTINRFFVSAIALMFLSFQSSSCKLSDIICRNLQQMEKQQQCQSVVYDLYNYSIALPFLDPAKYKYTHQQNKKSSAFYDFLCSQVENYYKVISEVPDKCKELLENYHPHEEKWGLSKFKEFLKNLFEIFGLISEFQIEGISTIRSSRMDVLREDVTFANFLNRIEQYANDQQLYEDKKVSFQKVTEQLDSKEVMLKKQMKKPQYNFNMKLMIGEMGEVAQKMSQKEKILSELGVLIEKISENSCQFEKDLLIVRHDFIKNKYKQLETLSRLGKNSKQSLMEIFSYLFDFIQKNKSTFNPIKAELVEVNQFKLMSYSKLSQYIISQTNNYDIILTQYIQILNKLSSSLSFLSKYSMDIRNGQMEFIQSLHKFYEYQECDISQIVQLFNSFNSFLRMLGELGDKLVFHVNTILQLQKGINKYKQMTLTLVKCKPQRRKSPTNSKRKDSFNQRDLDVDPNKYLDILNEEMSPTYIHSILTKTYLDFRETMNKMRDYFIVMKPQKTKINNSMSISYIETSSCFRQKKPSKHQKWLWKKWKEETKKDFKVEEQEEIAFFKELNKRISLFKEQDKDVENFHCILSNLKLQGILKLRQKSLIFESNDNSTVLFLPFSQIEHVDLQLSMISKCVIIEMSVGVLTFADSAEGNIKKFYVSIQKALDSHNQNLQKLDFPSNKVVLASDELEFIMKRKDQISKDLEPLQEYTKYETLVLQDLQIQDLFKEVYSGNAINVGGKQFKNFNNYLSKKLNNFNDTYTPFNPLPPTFYSGVEGVTFFNCSIYSERILQYDHILPKIPFFPEQCHNKQTVRAYWVSHQEFHIRQTNITSNAPFTQHFYLMCITVVKQVQKNVQVNFYMKIVEISDFTMKRIVYKEGINEYKNGLQLQIEHMKKVMAKYKKRGSATKRQSQVQAEASMTSEKTVIKEYKSKVQKLQSKNKYLQYILVGVFILNMIILYFC